MMKFRFGAIGCLAAMLFASPAFATDFTFTIPVNFTNLPADVASFAVTCYVYGPGVVVGNSPATVIPISGGAMSGDVTIAFNAAPGRDPATANRYQCSGYFIGHNTGGVPAFYFQDRSAPTFPLVSGAPFLLDTGNMPLGG